MQGCPSIEWDMIASNLFLFQYSAYPFLFYSNYWLHGQLSFFSPCTFGLFCFWRNLEKLFLLTCLPFFLDINILMLEILDRKGHVFLVEVAIYATLVVLFDFSRNFTFIQTSEKRLFKCT